MDGVRVARLSEGRSDVAETRVFRVFVSSTFRDLEAERNHLHQHVYPGLRDLCAQHGARFQPIDLRWGVSREASLDQQAMNVCLEEIDRCREVTPRPNFLVLLGNRHGWLAAPSQVGADEFEEIRDQVPHGEDRELLMRWYVRDANAVPPEYHLRPRTGAYAADDAWADVEARLHAILAGAAAKTDYLNDPKYTASATEQEILHGALGLGALQGRAFCFVRELTGGYPDPKTAAQKDPVLDFVDPDQGPLVELKRELRDELPFKEYEARWDPGTGRPTTDHLEDLGHDVREALTAAILDQIDHPVPSERRSTQPERIRTDTALDDEGRAHRAFAEGRCRIFVSREDELAAIAGHLDGEDARTLVIAGGGGTGKSALLAEALRRAQHDHADAEIVYRFIGATAVSSDVRALLQGLCQGLARRAGADETAVPTDYQELVADFRQRLETMGADRPLVVFLDSLDQLTPGQGARGLAWLPVSAPAGVRMVISTRPEDTLTPLQKRGAPMIELGPMPQSDGADLLRRWLSEAHRTLRPDQEQEVLGKFGASGGNPLYLQLAFQEARRWKGDLEPVEQLATGVEGIIAANTFGRLALEENHGTVLVSHALGYLAASRFGLAEDELLDLLSRDPEVYEWFVCGAQHVPPDLRERAREYRNADGEEALEEWLNAVRTRSDRSELRALLAEILPTRNGPRLPVVLWSRLAFDLRPYLTEREADGAILINFFHRELGDVADAEFLSQRALEYHGRLADYLRPGLTDEGRWSWDEASRRGLSELPYHLVGAERWDEVEETLTDFGFLEGKASRVAVEHRRDTEGNEVTTYSGVRRLEEDFDMALRAMRGGDVADRPRIIVTATDLGEGLVIRCPHCNTVHTLEVECSICRETHRLEEWRGKERTCTNPACRGPLRVNEFVVGGPASRQDRLLD
jgi:hypothetical protein